MNLQENSPKFKDLSNIFSSTPSAKTVEESRPSDSENEILCIPIEDTVPYHKHSFDCTEEDIEPDFLESIKKHGVQQPALARKIPDGKYEIIAGHKRRLGSILAGISFLPIILKEISDEEADEVMVHSNKQRPKTKPSEYARSIKVLYEAKKRQGARNDLLKTTSDTTSTETPEPVLSAYDIVAQEENITPSQVRRFVECGNLPLDLMRFMDTSNFTYSTGALLQALPSDTLTNLTLFLQENPKTKIKGKHIEALKQVELSEDNSIEQVFSDNKQEKKIATVSIPQNVLKELFDDNELDSMDETDIVAFIRKAIEQYRKGALAVE